MKLFGDFEGGGQGALLGRKSLAAEVKANPEFEGVFSDLFKARPILFVGASLDEVLADLATLQSPRPANTKNTHCRCLDVTLESQGAPLE